MALSRKDPGCGPTMSSGTEPGGGGGGVGGGGGGGGGEGGGGGGGRKEEEVYEVKEKEEVKEEEEVVRKVGDKGALGVRKQVNKVKGLKVQLPKI